MSVPVFRHSVPHSRPLVFAHRGGALLGPENTLEAFDRGLTSGADGLELDVRLSRDGFVVVIHDADLQRTTNAMGPVAGLTAAELASLDAAFHFKPEEGYPLRGQGVGVPRLRDVVGRYPDVPLIIELKLNSRALARATVDELRAASAFERVCLGGFAHRALAHARRCEPGITTGASHDETGQAVRRLSRGLPASVVSHQAYLVPEVWGDSRIVSPEFVRDAHQAGLGVYVWTVDAPEDIKRLIEWGVDGIITDRPDVAAPILKEFKD